LREGTRGRKGSEDRTRRSTRRHLPIPKTLGIPIMSIIVCVSDFFSTSLSPLISRISSATSLSLSHRRKFRVFRLRSYAFMRYAFMSSRLYAESYIIEGTPCTNNATTASFIFISVERSGASRMRGTVRRPWRGHQMVWCGKNALSERTPHIHF